MNETKLGPPYGPPANLHTIFQAWRERGMPAIVDRQWFEKIGLSANLTSRNLHALRFLGLVDAAARPTERAERLRTAPADGFASTLAATVRTAYAGVYQVDGPAEPSRRQIVDAFRHATPVAQRSRMVACFIGLWRLAALGSGDSFGRGASASPAIRHGGRRSHAAPIVAPVEAAAGAQVVDAPDVTPGADAILMLLLAKFPDFDPAWSDSLKEKWFDAFARFNEDLRR